MDPRPLVADLARSYRAAGPEVDGELYDNRLIRGDNLPAAVVLAGAILGFALPLASALRIADGFAMVAGWAVIALVAQLVAYGLVALLLRHFSRRINRGEMAAAVLAAATHVGVGLLNAAAMNY